MNGRIVTFYSWKGGVGRTMALANAGVQLARRGKRVLLVDWDLEAPGLDRYFVAADTETASLLSVTKPTDASGLLGLLAGAATRDRLEPDTWERRCITVRLPELPRADGSIPDLPTAHPLTILSAGLGSPDYASHLERFSWADFFANDRGGEWLEHLRSKWRGAYEFVLIDSRTGLTDGGSICTVQMPDVLVFAFTPNTQCLGDGLAFLDGVQRSRSSYAFERPPLTIVPLLSRWEGDREVDLADAWLDRIEGLISPLVENWLPVGVPRRRLLERLRVPHVARFSFGEPLPVLTHSLSDPDRPGLAYDLLAEVLGGGFADAGQIIDPQYRPPIDALHATDAEIDELARDDVGREAVIDTVRSLHGANSLVYINLLLRFARAEIRVGQMAVADELAQRAASLARPSASTTLETSSWGYSLRYGKAAGSEALVDALLLLADIRRQRRGLGEALVALREALSICRLLVEADPSNTAWQRKMSTCQDNIGDVLGEQGNMAGVLAAYREALAMKRRIADAQASNPAWQKDISKTQRRIGDLLRRQGDLAEALVAYREALRINVEFNDRHEQAVTYHQLGEVAQEQRQWAEAEKNYREALRIIAEFNDRYGQAATYYRLGTVAQEQRQWAEAEKNYREALRIFVELNDRYEQAATYHKLGEVAQQQQQWAEAEKNYREALRIFVELNDRYAQALPYHQLGDVAQEHQQWADAEKNYREALQIYVEVNDRYAQARSYHRLGEVAQVQQRWAEAEKYYHEALRIDVEFNDRHSQAVTYARLAMAALTQRHWADAEQNGIEALRIFLELSDQAAVVNLLRLLAHLNPERPSLARQVAGILGVQESDVDELFQKLASTPDSAVPGE
jgi:tetratricopeptide (TPR) repeat protein